MFKYKYLFCEIYITRNTLLNVYLVVHIQTMKMQRLMILQAQVFQVAVALPLIKRES